MNSVDISKREGRTKGNYVGKKPGKGYSDRLMMPGWIRQLKINPVPLLLKSKKPGIILDTYRYGYGLPTRTSYMIQAQKAADSSPSTVRLLKSDKTGDVHTTFELENIYGLEFLQCLILVEKLIRAGVNKNHPLIKPHIVKLMKFAREDGRFPLLYHHHAHACWLLLKLGMSGNRMLDRSILWILNRQRRDGGWHHRSLIPDGKSFDKSQSCIWTTAEIMQMITLRKSLLKEIDSNMAIKFLLSKVEMENKSLLMSDKSYWNKLGTGPGSESMFFGGTLKILEIAADLGFKKFDPLVDKCLRWLKNLQMDSGLFPLEAGKLTVSDEHVTVRVISVLRKFSRNEFNHDNSA